MKGYHKASAIVLLTIATLVIVSYLSLNINLPKIEKKQAEYKFEGWIVT